MINSFETLVNTILENTKVHKKYKVVFEGKPYFTMATSEKHAKTRIGARIHNELKLDKPHAIYRVIDQAKATVVTEKCWTGYIKRGMKKKGNRMVPNCVKKKQKRTK